MREWSASKSAVQLRTAGYYLCAPAICLALYWRVLFTWFRTDDFGYLYNASAVHNLPSLARALFQPTNEGTVRLLRSSFSGPVNIGSEEMVTINQLVDLVAEIAGKRIGKKHIAGPQGVRGRNSDNRLIKEKLHWAPTRSLRAGLEGTYRWIEQQVSRNSTQFCNIES